MQCALFDILAAHVVGQSVWSWLSNSRPVRIQYAGFVSAPTCDGKLPFVLMQTCGAGCSASENYKQGVCVHALLLDFLRE